MKVEKTKPGITHVLAICCHCPCRWDNYMTADADARQHVQESGHSVRVEQAQTWEYRKGQPR